MVRAIQEFEEITKFGLSSFFEKVENYFNVYYPNLVAYYEGKTNSIENNELTYFEDIYEDSRKVEVLFSQNRDSFNTFDFWELFDLFDDIKLRIWSVVKLSKWMRSSRTDLNWSKSFSYDYTLKQGQTLEDVSRTMNGSNNYNNDWTKIAIDNQISEDDYDPDGGNLVKLFSEKFQVGLITSVVDNLIGERVYGKDIQAKIEFTGGEDLKVLSYKDTLLQTVGILGTLRKSTIPEFPFIGIDETITVGTSKSNILYPSIVREMKKNFQTDDLFSEMNVNSFQFRQGALYISYSVGTKFELAVKDTRRL